jgi:AcrR family transcriptional regulator
MVGIRAKDHDDKRQLILDRAAELFARQGFHKTSISEISKACNVTSKAWIYHYFPNKEEVLFTLLRDFLELVSRRLRVSVREDHPPRVALRAFVGECLSIYAQYRINYPMLFAEMAALPPVPQAELRALEREIANLLRGLINRVNPSVGHRGKHAMAITLIAFGTINWTYTWFDAKGPLSLETVADLITEMLLNGLTAM